MNATCDLSALPFPTSDFFTSVGAYPFIRRARDAHAAMATPLACPSFSALETFLDVNTCSTAASSGFHLSSTPHNS